MRYRRNTGILQGGPDRNRLCCVGPQLLRRSTLRQRVPTGQPMRIVREIRHLETPPCRLTGTSYRPAASSNAACLFRDGSGGADQLQFSGLQLPDSESAAANTVSFLPTALSLSPDPGLRLAVPSDSRSRNGAARGAAQAGQLTASRPPGAASSMSGVPRTGVARAQQSSAARTAATPVRPAPDEDGKARQASSAHHSGPAAQSLLDPRFRTF